MFFKKLNKRHLVKTLTWRIVGSLDTFFLSWFISENLSFGIQIGLLEIGTKMILYYSHERFWFKSDIKDSNNRHIIKTFSWRFIGTIDTFVLSWIITGNPITGLKTGVIEVFTKILLYYGHEKLWYRINFGLNKRNNLKALNAKNS